jgi:hypothetical protein
MSDLFHPCRLCAWRRRSIIRNRSDEPRCDIRPCRPGPRADIRCVVRDARSESRHRGRRRPLVLDREPKESILAVFDMRVIRRYFPEFDDAFPGYLARLGGAPG